MADHLTLDNIFIPDPNEDKGQVLDLTGGKAKDPTPKVIPSANFVVGPDGIPMEETGPAVVFDPTNHNATPVEKKAVPVQSGPISQDTATVFDPTTLIPRKEIRDEGADEAFGLLDKAVERTKVEITQFHNELEEKMKEEFYEGMREQKAEESYSDSTANAYDKEVAVSEPISSVYDGDPYGDEGADTTSNVASDPTPVVNYVAPSVVSEPEHVEQPVKPVTRTIKPDGTEEDKEAINAYGDGIDDSKTTDDDKLKEQQEIEKDAEKYLEDLKSASRSAIKTKKTFDLSKFKIATNSVKPSTVILAKDKEEDVADWVRFADGIPVSMSALSGSDIIRLNPENSNRNRYNRLRDMYKIVYNHVVDANKPDFDTWLKQVKFIDLDHLYFGMFMATFHGSNFVSYRCDECKKVFIKEFNFLDMVKFEDKETEEKVKEIMSKPTDTTTSSYEVTMYQASEKYAFAMKIPSVYNTIMEVASLPESALRQYEDMLDTITYVDKAYVIDNYNQQLVPIELNADPKDPAKTAMRKIRIFNDIIASLTSDEFYDLRGFIASNLIPSTKITYQLPGTECPHCKHKIAADEDQTAEQLLFTRHQLGAFASM